jgi:hypothetical protein
MYIIRKKDLEEEEKKKQVSNICKLSSNEFGAQTGHC